jgi:hypothetical protein
VLTVERKLVDVTLNLRQRFALGYQELHLMLWPL